MGLSLSAIGANYRKDPDEYAKKYANQNGLSLEAAKTELKSKYGDPKKPEETTGANQEKNIFELGNSKPKGPAQNPDDFAEVYARQNNITVEQAKAELKQQFGDPEQKIAGGALNIMA